MITSCGLHHKIGKKKLDDNYIKGVEKLAREAFE
jgi:hypothetical protein